MKIHIPSFEQARVLIVGDVMLDRYWYGAASRISPEAPVPVVRIDNVEERPGGGANVAVNIATLGGKVRVLGITGADEAAAILKTKLDRLGIETDFMQLPDQATITKLRVLSHHQQLIRLDFEDGFPGFNPAKLLERFTVHLPEANAVVLSDYNKGALANVQDYIRQARALHRPIWLNWRRSWDPAERIRCWWTKPWPCSMSWI
jgi:D-beta-D-heptose 7-phosphate kinase/D-beta-D-heptose 1-phosphate adenosyltransferase